MMKMFLAVACAALAVPAAAQEREAGTAVAVNLVKFKAGAIERVNEIEKKYFDPASRTVGNSPIIIRMASGEWDREYIFPMKGGMAELDYKSTKEFDAWKAEVDRLAGGKGMADKLMAEWNAAVDHQRTDYGFSDQK